MLPSAEWMRTNLLVDLSLLILCLKFFICYPSLSLDLKLVGWGRNELNRWLLHFHLTSALTRLLVWVRHSTSYFSYIASNNDQAKGFWLESPFLFARLCFLNSIHSHTIKARQSHKTLVTYKIDIFLYTD